MLCVCAGSTAMTTFYAAILLLPLADGMTLFFLNPCLTGVGIRTPRRGGGVAVQWRGWGASTLLHLSAAQHGMQGALRPIIPDNACHKPLQLERCFGRCGYELGCLLSSLLVLVHPACSMALLTLAALCISHLLLCCSCSNCGLGTQVSPLDGAAVFKLHTATFRSQLHWPLSPEAALYGTRLPSNPPACSCRPHLHFFAASGCCAMH